MAKKLKQKINATFSLDENSIAALDEWSEKYGIAKSIIVRLLVAHVRKKDLLPLIFGK